MLGALTASNVLPFGEKEITAVMKESIPARFLDLNTRAFKLGENAFKKAKID
jgi:Pyruvate/2-oxoacid:ferredoxin oxidoreductase gamma subunit